MKFDVAEFLSDQPVPTTVVHMVPVVYPAQRNGIALVGDCPYDADAQLPFTNSHFGALASLLHAAGINIKECLQMNVLPYYPANGSLASVNSAELAKAREEMTSVLRNYKPTCIIVLGRETFHQFKSGSLDDERGFPFLWYGIPAVACFHPKELFVQWKYNLPTIADLTKAAKIARDGYKVQTFNNLFKPKFEEACEMLRKFLQYKPALAFDIETANAADGRPYVTCIGFAYNATSAIVIPFREAGRHVWTEAQECQLWVLVAHVCEECPMFGHYAVHYEHTVLSMTHKILPNVVGDTMLMQWELQPELEKSLAFCASVYTDLPYWKSDLKAARSGKIPAWREFEYNGNDNLITYQVAEAIKPELMELPSCVTEHYRFNIRCSRVFQYMSVRGVLLDKPKWETRLKELAEQELVIESEFQAAAGKMINVNSSKQMKSWLYEELKLPVQYKTKKQDDGSYEDVESQDYLSLLYLARSYPNIKALTLAAKLRKHKKRLSALRGYNTRPNGYISWGFNIVGAETGRISGYKPVDGMGVQPQNVDSRDKDLFLAGDGYYWLKADLEGADGWTVGACCARLGDSTMLDDLRAGLKPAQALAIAQLFGHHLISEPASELLKYKKQFKQMMVEQETVRGLKRTDYDVWKAVSHGSNYGMKKRTMHDNIFKKSNGELFVPEDDCQRFQLLYYKRYKGLPKWHEYTVSQLNSTGYIDAFSGTHRNFLGRKDNSTLRIMLAHAPQAHTSYATNKLLEKLYYLPVNRRADGLSLIIEPVNQVHDETDLLFRKNELDLCREIFFPLTKLPMKYWGVEFEIPFEVMYGENWGDCENEL